MTAELGTSIATGGYDSNVLVWGDPSTQPVALLVHGSGPGSTAHGSWAWIVPALRDRGLAVVAPDVAGFGFTERVDSFAYGLPAWSDQLAALLDSLAVPRAHVVGNSLGGAIALALAIREPGRVDRLAVMGSVGMPHAITPALERIWGYEPSLDAMRALIRAMPADPSVVTEAAVAARYEASTRPGWQGSFRAMFPHPLQGALDAMALDPADLRRVDCPALVLHGREDPVIPFEGSLELARLLPKADLRVFAGLGHWPSVERPATYAEEISRFLA